MTAQLAEIEETYGPSPTLPARLLLKGWAKVPTDICWMDCSRPGHNLRLRSGWEITLCSAHIKQLDRAAEEAGGYSHAAPPPKSKATAWPWQRWAQEPEKPSVFKVPSLV